MEEERKEILTASVSASEVEMYEQSDDDQKVIHGTSGSCDDSSSSDNSRDSDDFLRNPLQMMSVKVTGKSLCSLCFMMNLCLFTDTITRMRRGNDHD